MLQDFPIWTNDQVRRPIWSIAALCETVQSGPAEPVFAGRVACPTSGGEPAVNPHRAPRRGPTPPGSRSGPDRLPAMQLTVLAGGLGGARLVRALRTSPVDLTLTVVGNTAADVTLYGLRLCPDLDLLHRAVARPDGPWPGEPVDEARVVQTGLLELGALPAWYPLADTDLAAPIARSQWLGQGRSLSDVTARIHAAGDPGDTRLLPMSDEPVETHVVLEDPAAEGGLRAVHLQEWAHLLHPATPPRRFSSVGLDRARPTPAALEAIRSADAVVLAPGDPVTTFGTMLALPGLRDALRGTNAPVIGVAPLPTPGSRTAAALTAVGLAPTQAAVGDLFADLLQTWIVDPDEPAASAAHTVHARVDMPDPAAGAQLAQQILQLAATR